MPLPTSTAPAAARTLADALRGWDDDALVALMLARPDVARPAPTDLGQLAARVAGRGSVAVAIDQLDTAHVSVLEALCLLPDPVTSAAVSRIVHAAPTTVTAVLDRLRSLALVWGDDTDLRLVRAAHDVLGPTPAGLGPSLVTLLTASRPAKVAALAADLDLAAGGDPVATAVRVADSYADPAWARARIDEAAAAAGDDVHQLLARLAPGPPTGRLGRVPPEARVATATTTLEHLLARGLLVAIDDQTVALPREVGLHLRAGRTTAAPVDAVPAPTTHPADPAAVDRIGAGAAFDAVRRVELVLESWGSRPPAVLRSGGVGVRDMRAAAAELDVGVDETGLLLEVARAAGLVAVGDDAEVDEVWLPTDDFDEWRERPAAHRWALLAAAWLHTPRATVLVGARDDRNRPVSPLSPDLERGAAATVRRVALAVLAGTEPGAAVDDPEQVVAAVTWQRPRRAVLRDALVRRSLVEAGWLGITARGALTTAGRALVTPPGDTDGAARLLAPLLPQPVDHVLLQADLTAVAPGPLAPSVAHGLALLAEVESRGGATVYRFSADSVRRALDAGWPASEVHAFLQTHSRTPVPQPLSYLVDDAARRHGRLRVGGAAVYVRADDPGELDTLLADSSLASLGLRRLAPTVALSHLAADVVLSRLRQAHRAPLLEAADGRTVDVAQDSRRARSPQVRRDASVVMTRLDGDQAGAVVAAMRAGERARAARPKGEREPSAARLVEQLRAAADAGRPVWLAYLDETGTVSERVVEPRRVDGGRLTAYDQRSATTRAFALHRINRVTATG